MATTPSAPERVIRLPGGRRVFYDRLSEAERAQADVELAELDRLLERNPIQGFEPHPGSPAQREALEASTPVVAVFAGNQFGKTTTAVVKAACQLLPEHALPERMRRYKRFTASPKQPVQGWMLCPTEDKIFDSIKPAFEKWIGAEFFRGGSWGKAFNGERMMLTFVDPRTQTVCGTLAFKTYKQDPSTLGGATLHFVIYDEPPPIEHREECLTRLLAHNGFEFFAMTPLKTNTGWIRREIFKKREHPDITVVRGSMHDNPALDAVARERILATYHNDLWRRAREFGDFVDVGGQIYELAERRLAEPWAPGDERAVRAGRFADVVVGIDPGVRNCGIVFKDFDAHNVGTVFDELLIQDGTVEDYAVGIKARLAYWGIPLARVDFRIDPKSATARTMVDKQTVAMALAILGIGCTPGENAVEAGIQQVRGRLQGERLWICRNCVLLRDELDEYAAEDRPDGEFKVIKENDHLCDALRYGCMARPFYPAYELAAPSRNLGAPVFRPGHALPASQLVTAPDSPPLGFMS